MVPAVSGHVFTRRHTSNCFLRCQATKQRGNENRCRSRNDRQPKEKVHQDPRVVLNRAVNYSCQITRFVDSSYN